MLNTIILLRARFQSRKAVPLKPGQGRNRSFIIVNTVCRVYTVHPRYSGFDKSFMLDETLQTGDMNINVTVGHKFLVDYLITT
jgi:hypothetical protein